MFLGFVSVLLAIVGYGIYFKQIFSGKIKPHAFSWFVWSLTVAIIFFGQLAKGAGAGAWVTGAISLACFAISILALFKGYRDFIYWDWVFLFVCLLSLVFWWLTKDPTISLILITVTDIVATFPTLYKTYNNPFEESLTLFSLNTIRSVIAIFAFQAFTFVSAIYPVKLIVFNFLIAGIIFFRRRQLTQA